MTNWLGKNRAFGGAYLKGQVAAMEGRERKDCPYDAGLSQFHNTMAKAWTDGYDSVRRACDDRTRLPQKA